MIMIGPVTVHCKGIRIVSSKVKPIHIMLIATPTQTMSSFRSIIECSNCIAYILCFVVLLGYNLSLYVKYDNKACLNPMLLRELTFGENAYVTPYGSRPLVFIRIHVN